MSRLLISASKLGFKLEDVAMKGFDFTIHQVAQDLTEMELVAIQSKGIGVKNYCIELIWINVNHSTKTTGVDEMCFEIQTTFYSRGQMQSRCIV